MTQTVTTYEALIIPEHQNQPNLTATIDLSTQPFVDEQNILNSMVNLFDLDLAVGVQLDAVGARIGRSRYLDVPISGAYFSYDVVGLGWDQGYWQGQFDPTQGIVALDDTTYRALLRTIILANVWNGTISQAANILAGMFNSTYTPGTNVFVYDNMNMTMVIGLAGVTPAAIFIGLLNKNEINLKPVGVAVSYQKSSVSGTPLFGYDVENSYISGWDVGAWSVPL